MYLFKQRKPFKEEEYKNLILKEFDWLQTFELKDDANFIHDLSADSLEITSLVERFEKKYGIKIPDEDLEKLETVGKAKEYIKEKMTGR